MQKSDRALRKIAAWVSFLFVSVGFMGLCLKKSGEFYFYWRGIDPGSILTGFEVIVFTIVILILTVLFFYIGVALWLCLARLLFSKAEVEAVAYAVPHTRFDKWLVNTIFKK